MDEKIAEALEYLSEKQIKLLDIAIKEKNEYEKLHWLRVANSRKTKKVAINR